MTVTLPAPAQTVVDAINNADYDAFVAAFTEHGAVNDWGNEFKGGERLRAWAKSDAIGAGAKMTPTTVTESGGKYTVVAEWASKVFNGSSKFIFTIEGDKVAEMRMPPA